MSRSVSCNIAPPYPRWLARIPACSTFSVLVPAGSRPFLQSFSWTSYLIPSPLLGPPRSCFPNHMPKGLGLCQQALLPACVSPDLLPSSKPFPRVFDNRSLYRARVIDGVLTLTVYIQIWPPLFMTCLRRLSVPLLLSSSTGLDREDPRAWYSLIQWLPWLHLNQARPPRAWGWWAVSLVFKPLHPFLHLRPLPLWLTVMPHLIHICNVHLPTMHLNLVLPMRAVFWYAALSMATCNLELHQSL